MPRLIVLMFCAAAFLPQHVLAVAASQEWVKSHLATAGVRVSMANVTTNVVNGVTNIVITSPFNCADVPEAKSIRLTVSPVDLSYGDADVDRSRPYVSCTIYDGSFSDGVSWFSFARGWTLEMNIPMPNPLPAGKHVCEIGAGCSCVMAENTRESLLESLPEDYKEVTFEKAARTFPSPLAMIDTDTWGSESWQRKVTVGQNVLYFVTDSPPAGLEPRSFNVEAIGDTDAWAECVVEMRDKWNVYIDLLREMYITDNLCDKENPQHERVTKTCGSHSWTVCGRNCGWKEGTEQHQYPGSSINDTYHSCVCGNGDPKEHGTLVASGTKTYAYNSSGKETGWTQTFVCPAGCDLSKSITHVHHFTNCGTCDAGDGCSTTCTGCSGEHVFGDATATKCAKCECTTCDDCDAHPPYTETSKHVGWHPCGDADEEDNDNADGTAAGLHCACQCLAWGHNAARAGTNPSAHDYHLPAGMGPYEQINDASATVFRKTHHYELIGQCSRCEHWKKRRRVHDFSDGVVRHDHDDDSATGCVPVKKCKASGCGQEERQAGQAHVLEGAIVYEPVVIDGSPKCRRRQLCTNCKTYIVNSTNNHTKDASKGCKCANGCGYQFDHTWFTDACGNERCSACGTSRYGQEVHSGYMTNGTRSEDGHQCACGRMMIPHTASQTECDCICGYYASEGQVAPSALHHWTPGGTNDNPACICNCGNMHKFRNMTPYESSRFANGQTNITQCLGICFECRERDINGNRVADSQHSEFTSASDQVKAARCGCKCGKVSSVGAERFHYQNTTGVGGLPRCRCYGQNARASGAVAGEYHFRVPADCPKVCYWMMNGNRHLVAQRDKEWDPEFHPAHPSDHTAKDGYGTCGCKCEDYTTANLSAWNGKADLHRQYSSSDCRCGCSAYKHYPIKGENCPKLCKGTCGGLVDDKKYGDTPNAASIASYHTPSASQCGCQCGGMSASSLPSNPFHNIPNSTESCFCECKKHHKFAHPRSDCTRICSTCSPPKTILAGVDPQQAADKGQHTFPAASCYCACGKELHKGGHQYADDSCVCYCHAETRGHKYGGSPVSTETEASYTCERCNQTITKYKLTYICQRCSAAAYGYYETGHDSDCGLQQGEPGVPQYYCEKHHFGYTEGECPECKKEEEEDSGESGSGGETGGSGGLNDI